MTVLSSRRASTGWTKPNSRRLRVSASSSASEIRRGLAGSGRSVSMSTCSICIIALVMAVPTSSCTPRSPARLRTALRVHGTLVHDAGSQTRGRCQAELAREVRDRLLGVPLHQPERVADEVALLAFDQLAGLLQEQPELAPVRPRLAVADEHAAVEWRGCRCPPAPGRRGATRPSLLPAAARHRRRRAMREAPRPVEQRADFGQPWASKPAAFGLRSVTKSGSGLVR